MKNGESTAATAKGVSVPERFIPFPKSISVEAQAALESARWALPPLPELGDKLAWRDLVEKSNANLAQTIREQIASIPGCVSHETIAGVPVYVAEPESVPTGNQDKAMVFFHGGGLVMGGGEAVGLFARLDPSRTAAAFTRSTLAIHLILAPSTMALRSITNC